MVIDAGVDFAFLNANRFVEDLSSKTLSGLEKDPSSALQYSSMPDSSAETTQLYMELKARALTGWRWSDVVVYIGLSDTVVPLKISILLSVSLVTANSESEAPRGCTQHMQRGIYSRVTTANRSGKRQTAILNIDS